ncbi:hypothetical protein O181_004302 [Austropuccinia psidii MF-1]|uniref:Uncharacterized protein n=1 Tax=Austropuccinia psidii MF-1 TaxID=1389203 RepID=A0A9Q3BFZ3_9BASI|nr:hypothetical protein [Austropuccinia psidii MF-1]
MVPSRALAVLPRALVVLPSAGDDFCSTDCFRLRRDGFLELLSFRGGLRRQDIARSLILSLLLRALSSWTDLFEDEETPPGCRLPSWETSSELLPPLRWRRGLSSREDWFEDEEATTADDRLASLELSSE